MTRRFRRPRGPSLAHRLRIEAHAVWLAARDRRTPWAARIVGLLIAAYALSPIDLVPDFIPVLGLVDDALLIPAGVWLFERLVSPTLMAEHRATAEAAARRPIAWSGVVIVLTLWGLAAWLVWSVFNFAYD
ncbi:YkvA family protein [Hephaestia sp. GCM10023244]|uniref:YkvA family protein n=1 Tax=unclassified Hephaestia TaxID=2631281 RepID=UPI00207777F9|nr:YkvA family protein [Hephaestia sp. MAHUQ-44]MCM8729419.1 YkvA family protein [Hephaestia sp. MAHUQ-44]